MTVTDKRRIDPDTGEVREPATGPAPSGPAPEPRGRSRDGDRESDEVAELTADLQRVKAEYANYRKRAAARPAGRRRARQGRGRHPVAAACSTISTGPAATATWSPVR